MTSSIPLKRSFEATGLHNSVESSLETSVYAQPHALFSDVQSQPEACNVMDALGGISRETSPLSSTATSTTRENSAVPVVSTVTTTVTTSKKRKLTFAGREVIRIEKQYKEQQKAEEKARKDEEKRAKEEERRIKEEEAKETKRKREEEREEKRKLREAENQLKNEEKRKREAEKKAKGDEKAKKERSQLRLNSFFTKPSAHIGGGSECHNRSGPSSRRSSISSLEDDKPNGQSHSATMMSDEDTPSDYTRTFPPFFVHAHTDVAPPSRFNCNNRNTASYDFDINTTASQSTEFGGTASASITFSIRNLFPASRKRRRITPRIIAVKGIVAGFHGSATEPIDLTQARKKSQCSPADLLKAVPVKYLRYVEDVRPPYIGTYSKTPVKCSPSRLLRRPFLRALPATNYDYDSEAEWEEPEEGEDLDSEGEEEIGEDELGDDMEEFLDDDDAEGYGAKRRNLMGDVQPICTGLIWDSAASQAQPNVITYGDTTLDLNSFRTELLFTDTSWPFDPYSTSYWPTTQSGTVDSRIYSSATMAPPRVPLSIIQKNSNIPPSSAPQPGTDTKIGDATCLPVKPSTNKPKNSAPSKPIPSELLEDFKKAIEGSDLTKAGLVEVLKKRFPSITKGTVQDTIALVAERVGKKESDKRWRLL